MRSSPRPTARRRRVGRGAVVLAVVTTMVAAVLTACSDASLTLERTSMPSSTTSGPAADSTSTPGASTPGTSTPGASTRTATTGGATPSGTSPTGADGNSFRPGAAGLGDPYFPLAGNGGYDVTHYDLVLSYDPTTPRLAGTVTIDATATQDLSRFDLDLSGMTVSAVTVDGATASYARSGQELQITPARGLDAGHKFRVAVTYAGAPRTIVGSPVVFGSAYGWIYTDDGAFVGDEPDAARTWFPGNDHPSDKATFSFEITVPSDRKVVANGDLLATKTVGAKTTFDWNETSPMVTYLATIDIGKWTFAQSRTPAGIREFVAYDPSLAGLVAARKEAVLTGQVTDYWAQMFGPYPFTSTGAIIDNVRDIGFSLETQTRPLYGFAPDPETVSHELAHQWFGDSVSVRTWRDIWLNEGFATFAANLWAEHTGEVSTWVGAQRTFQSRSASDPFWNQAIADPQRDTMFSTAVYVRGGLTLAALRHRIGDAKFFTLLKTWTAQHRYGNATTSQFVALANQVSGLNLNHFFQIWLYTKARPASLTAG